MWVQEVLSYDTSVLLDALELRLSRWKIGKPMIMELQSVWCLCNFNNDQKSHGDRVEYSK